jgi:hypothetical protein
MPPMRTTLLLACLALSCAHPKAAGSTPGKAAIVDETSAVAALEAYVDGAKVYSDTKCIVYMVEETTPSYFDVAARERHEGDCGGDPAVTPLRDRFRVLRTGEIQLYQAGSDDYLTVKPAP